MKKIIAILLALAVVSMAFAQTVNMSNTLETRPVITVNNGTTAWSWGAERFDGAFLRDTIEASGETGDGRGKFDGKVYGNIGFNEPNAPVTGIMNVVPRIGLACGIGADFIGTYKATDFLAFGVSTWMAPYAAGGYLGSVFNMPRVNDGNENGSWWTAGGNQGDNWGAWGDANWWNGAFVTFLGDGVGIDGLKASLRFNADYINKNTFSFGAQVTYNPELFGVTLRYDGTFGDNDATLPAGSNERKGYYNHEIAAGVAFRGLKDLAVGIDLGAAFDAVFSKGASGHANSIYGAGVGATFDFRNSITDKLWARVGFGQSEGVTYKVLPFGVGNELVYKIGGDYDATFSFELAYLQNGLDRKLKEADGKRTLANSNDIYVYPRFAFTMGKSSFVFGVKNDVSGHLEYTEKNENDWAYTKLFGDQVRVEIPIKWTYKF